jgi:hypothetical protein
MSEETESSSTDEKKAPKPKAVGNSGNANLRGYLWRLGGGTSIFSKNTWKKRWCVLSNGQFFYYATREEWAKLTGEAAPKGSSLNCADWRT